MSDINKITNVFWHTYMMYAQIPRARDRFYACIRFSEPYDDCRDLINDELYVCVVLNENKFWFEQSTNHALTKETKGAAYLNHDGWKINYTSGGTGQMGVGLDVFDRFLKALNWEHYSEMKVHTFFTNLYGLP